VWNLVCTAARKALQACIFIIIIITIVRFHMELVLHMSNVCRSNLSILAASI
jgi:hypothetical protein